jgi:hypothetical protein
MSKTSPTQRTLAHFRKLGYPCAVTEKWNQFSRIRQDLFGFVDVLLIDHIAGGVIGVQATTGDHVAERQRKIEGLEAAAAWLDAGNRICVIGWRKLKQGKRALWTPRIEYARRSEGAWSWEEVGTTTTCRR